MKSHDIVLDFKVLDAEAIASIKTTQRGNNGKTILVKIPNTHGVSSDMVLELPQSVEIRVAGGYNDRFLEKFKNSARRYSEYYDGVIYSRNTLYNIVREIEKIEKDIDPEYSNIQKAICVYERLKKSISYDPKYEEKATSEIRSLRGLTSKKTVCAGYALIYKEILNRQNVDCTLVIGGSSPGKPSSHAWNCFKTEEGVFPVDLTWDAGTSSKGEKKTNSYFASIERFNKSHIPDDDEPILKYADKFKSIPQEKVDEMAKIFNRKANYETTYDEFARDDGTKAMIAQIGGLDHGDKTFYRYMYANVSDSNNISPPVCLFSESNIFRAVDCERFNRPFPKGYLQAAANVLFSEENVNDSLAQGSCYIGRLDNKKINNGYLETTTKTVSDVKKPAETLKLLRNKQKSFERSDGTKFTVQQMSPPAEGTNITRYDVLEFVENQGKTIPTKYSVFSEQNLFAEDRQGFADNFLAHDRLDKKYHDAGGYLGHYDESGFHISNLRYIKQAKIKPIDDKQFLAKD